MDASVIDLLPPSAELLADSASFQALSEAAAESLLGLLPTVGLSADSHGHERIVKTFGIKKNQINRLLDQVRNNGKFNKLRTFPYNGGKHTFFPHLRINYSHRVYFDYMPDDGQRIVIGYVGQHLASDKSATV